MKQLSLFEHSGVDSVSGLDKKYIDMDGILEVYRDLLYEHGLLHRTSYQNISSELLIIKLRERLK